MQRNSSGMPACASCKHQRKKCSEKCVLAPFFTANKSREFQAVHKVFGVSNVTKIVKDLKEEDKKRAIDSLVWEAFCRQKDPVLGPYGEYRKVYEELKLYKSQYQHVQVPPLGNGMYKPTPNLVGWNNNNGISNNTLNYIHNDHESSIHADSSSAPYSYSSDHLLHGLERIRQERDVSSVIILPQQHSINGLNQQYYLSGICIYIVHYSKRNFILSKFKNGYLFLNSKNISLSKFGNRFLLFNCLHLSFLCCHKLFYN
ncbi:LOB domain-containing protein [Actinidia chinensis var. chinensis]|uniref:LOB domain-containing protein n=1 Tax=Actinidia chinensis var. chinensis TaxID=1590841 RepID=A0A2R6QTN9_ACTCC|nr:LOB domain-containing protein [Actinidia chinensis var. chinensis]